MMYSFVTVSDGCIIVFDLGSGCSEDSAWWMLPMLVQADPGSALPHIYGASSGGTEKLHHQRQVSFSCFTSKSLFMWLYLYITIEKRCLFGNNAVIILYIPFCVWPYWPFCFILLYFVLFFTFSTILGYCSVLTCCPLLSALIYFITKISVFCSTLLSLFFSCLLLSLVVFLIQFPFTYILGSYYESTHPLVNYLLM